MVAVPFVIDASVVAAWLLPDEGHVQADLSFQRLETDHAVAPELWWFEVRNVFIVNERRGRIDRAQTSEALSLLAALPLNIDRDVRDPDLLDLARRHRLTVYDAAYLELARRGGWPLATLDNALARAAVAEGVAVIGL
ncbi:type II toxin-antitoxin system VapC family toxin [Tistrella mobilis]|uniref:type II toxin-antitoxin system VapC family toxin n=1 Tax=Tistrella mobilis TaxID=171437 RepID=UPI0035566D7A